MKSSKMKIKIKMGPIHNQNQNRSLSAVLTEAVIAVILTIMTVMDPETQPWLKSAVLLYLLK